MSMSLNEIRNVILLFSNPSWKGDGGTVSSTVIRNITALSSQMAYSARFTGNTTVLSTRYAGSTSTIIAGLLYVPDFPSGDLCIYQTAPHIPLSAVRQANLPPTNYHLIAIAPWVNDHCASASLAAARLAPVRAFLFYFPGSGDASPPPSDSPEWYIRGSADWMDQTGYPVFAVSGMAGEVMMQHLSLYSGNITQVPFGQNITDRFLTDAEDYVRIWTELDLVIDSMTFGAWVYFLVVVGVLLAVICSTSFLMHLVQARRRAGLRRRVLAGEVNLEAMGIKHLTVPLEHIQQFPLFTYNYEPEISSPPLSPQSAKANRSRARTRSLDHTESAAASRVTPPATISELGLRSPFAASATATDYQPNCEICLEPYENRVTIIRELPCGHIFHPECIDEFLHEVSSLCPICKAGMLPEGFCPKVTNTMVRRERAIRRLRGRIDAQDSDEGSKTGQPRPWWAAPRSRIFGMGGDRASPAATELKEARPRPKKRPPRRVQADPQGPPPPVTRERMRELAGFEPDYGEGGSTRWQRIRSRIFPGFH
ncbi:hypothetical protein VTI74DRAFT_10160 [Chaetomium olivicolor]